MAKNEFLVPESHSESIRLALELAGEISSADEIKMEFVCRA